MGVSFQHDARLFQQSILQILGTLMRKESPIYVVDLIKKLINYKGFQVAHAKLEGLCFSS